MTQTLTTEELRQIVETDHVQCGDAAAMARELLANREAQPVYQCRFFTTDVDGKQIGEWQDMDKGFYDQYDPYCRRILYTAPPAPAVNIAPDFEAWFNSPEAGFRVVNFHIQHELQLKAWNACRAAMLAQPVSQGYKLVPVEPTPKQWAAGVKAIDTGMDKVTLVYKAMLAAAPEGGNG